MPSPDDALATIREAASGLTYPSEEDAPLTAFRWSGARWPDAQSAVLADCGYGPKDELPPITTVSPEKFFAELADSDDADRFDRLRNTLEKTLTDLTVYRLGTVRIAIYVIGRTSACDYAGVWTTSVET